MNLSVDFAGVKMKNPVLLVQARNSVSMLT